MLALLVLRAASTAIRLGSGESLAPQLISGCIQAVGVHRLTGGRSAKALDASFQRHARPYAEQLLNRPMSA